MPKQICSAAEDPATFACCTPIETGAAQGLRSRKDTGPENLARVTGGGRVRPMRGKLKKAAWDDHISLNLISTASSPSKVAEGGKIQTR